MLIKKPMVLCFAGPNGSGKSTITKFFDIVGIYTNADDFVASSGISNEEATKFLYEKRLAFIDEKVDFTFETVLSSKYNMDLLKKAKDNGYFIKCIFVLTSNPDINIVRVNSRVETGGHDVNHEKIVNRYKKSVGNIKELLTICDILHVYDNSGDFPKRIVRKHKEEDIIIYPNEFWTEKQIVDLIH